MRPGRYGYLTYTHPCYLYWLMKRRKKLNLAFVGISKKKQRDDCRENHTVQFFPHNVFQGGGVSVGRGPPPHNRTPGRNSSCRFFFYQVLFLNVLLYLYNNKLNQICLMRCCGFVTHFSSLARLSQYTRIHWSRHTHPH